jgi:xylulokinase
MARASAPHTMLADLPPGHMEQHARAVARGRATTVRAVLRRSIASASRDSASPASSTAVSCSTARARGAPGEAVVRHRDRRRGARTDERLGRAVPTGFTASKVLWLQRHEPANVGEGGDGAAAARLREPLAVWRGVDGVRRRVGHRLVRSGDAHVRPVAMAAIDPRCATRAAAAACARHVRWAARRRDRGEPARPSAGLPVATGGGDNMMAAIGSGATSAGVVVASLGTSGTIFTRTESPVVDPHGRDRAVLQQRWRLAAAAVRDERHRASPKKCAP